MQQPQPMADFGGSSSGSSCTLFVAGLGTAASEEELQRAFSQQPGLISVKMKGGGGRPPVAWIKYDNAESSAKALNALQGTMLDSSDRGGIRIEFAKADTRR